jgi:hypothetical protein
MLLRPRIRPAGDTRRRLTGTTTAPTQSQDAYFRPPKGIRPKAVLLGRSLRLALAEYRDGAACLASRSSQDLNADRNRAYASSQAGSPNMGIDCALLIGTPAVMGSP